MSAFTRYQLRTFGRLGLWEFDDWRIKAYGISAHPPEDRLTIDDGTVAAAKAYVQDYWPAVATMPHYAVGYVVLHHGTDAHYALIHWWTDECICRHHLAISTLADATRFAPAAPDLMTCVWELVPIDFERRAWVDTTLSGTDVAAYLTRWLPDGRY